LPPYVEPPVAFIVGVGDVVADDLLLLHANEPSTSARTTQNFIAS